MHSQHSLCVGEVDLVLMTLIQREHMHSRHSLCVGEVDPVLMFLIQRVHVHSRLNSYTLKSCVNTIDRWSVEVLIKECSLFGFMMDDSFEVRGEKTSIGIRGGWSRFLSSQHFIFELQPSNLQKT